MGLIFDEMPKMKWYGFFSTLSVFFRQQDKPYILVSFNVPFTLNILPDEHSIDNAYQHKSMGSNLDMLSVG